MKKIFMLLFAATALMVAPSCEDDNTDDTTITDPDEDNDNEDPNAQKDVFITGFEFDAVPKSIDMGETVDLAKTVEVLPEDTNSKVTYTSSDATIATVTAEGSLTGVAAGTVTITAKSSDKDAVTDTFDIEVIKAVVYVSDFDLTELPESLSGDIDATFNLSDYVTATPTTADNTAVTFAIVSGDAVSIEGSTVTLVKSGEVEFSVTAQDEEAYSENFKISFIENIDITITPVAETLENSADYDIFTILDTYQVEFTLSKEVEAPAITWTSSNPAVATVSDSGLVTFTETVGSTTIKAAYGENSDEVELTSVAGYIRENFSSSDTKPMIMTPLASFPNQFKDASYELHEGYMALTLGTSTKSDTSFRITIQGTNVTIDAKNYPIIAFKADDVRNMYEDSKIGYKAKPGLFTAFNSKTPGQNQLSIEDQYEFSTIWYYDISTIGDLVADGKYEEGVNSQELNLEGPCTTRVLEIKQADVTADTGAGGTVITSAPVMNYYWMRAFKTVEDLKAYIAAEEALVE